MILKPLVWIPKPLVWIPKPLVWIPKPQVWILKPLVASSTLWVDPYSLWVAWQAHAVQEETAKTAGMALPPTYFSARTQRGLLAVAGPLAILRIPDRKEFIRQFVGFRFWLLQLATVLQRTAVDPQPDCGSEWIPTDAATGNRGAGYHGHWYTPGWPWPFAGG